MNGSFLRDSGRFKRHIAVRVLLLGITFHANHILHIVRLGFSFPKLLTQSPGNSFIIFIYSSEGKCFGGFVPLQCSMAELGSWCCPVGTTGEDLWEMSFAWS